MAQLAYTLWSDVSSSTPVEARLSAPSADGSIILVDSKEGNRLKIDSVNDFIRVVCRVLKDVPLHRNWSAWFTEFGDIGQNTCAGEYNDVARTLTISKGTGDTLVITEDGASKTVTINAPKAVSAMAVFTGSSYITRMKSTGAFDV